MGTLSVAIASNPVTVYEKSFELDDSISSPSTLMFRVRDDSGLNHYTKGQPVSITDSVSGLEYTGFVTAAIEDRVSPQTLIKTDIHGIDNTYLAQKRTYDGKEAKNIYAGAMLCQLLNVLSSEGITAQYASDRDTTAGDFNAGTLTNVVGTSNVDDGDLELALAGVPVTIFENSGTQFSAGTNSGITVSGNTWSPAKTNAMKMVAVCSLVGAVNAYTYVKVWGGSHAITANDVFLYQIWIDPSSPNGAMGVDLLFTDGTTLRDQSIFQDGQGIPPHPKNDLFPYAKGQWYQRSISINDFSGKTLQSAQIVCEGDATGTYTCWVKNVQLANGPFNLFAGSLTTNPPQQMQKNGYSSTVVSVASTCDAVNASHISAAFDVSGAGILRASSVTWNAVEPSGLTFQLSYSIDGGATYFICTKNTSLPYLLAGMNLAGKSIIFKEQFILTPQSSGSSTSITPELIPVLSFIQLTVNPSYAATKSDVNYELHDNAGWSAGTFTASTNNSGGTLSTVGAVRNWDDGNFSNQTTYGAGFQQALVQRGQYYIQAGNTGDARSRMDWAGTFADGVIEFDVLLDNANIKYGCTWRTTSWLNGDGTEAYQAEITTTTVKIFKGSNGGGFVATQIGTTGTLAATSGNWHHVKVTFVGSAHNVYVDDILYASATDGTYTAAGYVALRQSNNSAGNYTAYFDNFGVQNAALTGQWIGPNQSLTAAATYGNSVITWQDVSTDPGSTDTVLVESQTDGSTWQICTNGSAIPGLVAGQSLSGINLKLRITLTTSTASTLPGITGVVVNVLGQFLASGNRISLALPLANVGRLGGSVIAWNAILASGCTLGVDTRVDSGSWVDRTASPGEAVPGITPQPAPTVDSFAADSSVNYTRSNQGGTNTVATYDTANSRITLTGGNIGFYVGNLAVSVGDLDMFVDMDQSEDGGCIFHYIDVNNLYELVLRDGSSGQSPASSMTLFRTLSGVRTQIAQATGLVWPRGSYHRFRVTVAGAVMAFYMDGAQKLTYTDGTPVGAGKCGLRNNVTAAASRYYQINIQPLGQDASSHTFQTRLRLASTNPQATPQVTDVSLCAFGTTIGLGSIIPQTNMFHKYIDKCIDDLAKTSNYWWYIDKNLKFYFLATNGMNAPWIGSSTPGWIDPGNGSLQADFQDANITVEDSSDLYRNRQIIENVLAQTTINEMKVGDGVSTSWTFGSEWAGAPTIIITVGGQATLATVGVKNVDSGKQFYYAVGDPTITEDGSGPVYTSAFSINFSGPGQYLTYSQYDDIAAQAARQAVEQVGTGIVTNVEDGTGLTKAQGDALARARVAQYGKTGRLLKATSRRGGLAPGQLFNVFLPEHGINDGLFLIRQIQTRLTTEGPTGSMVQQPWQTIEAISGADVGDWTKLFQRPTNLAGFNKDQKTGVIPMALSYNVQNAPFNAVGDGVNDDTSAINSALAVAGATGGYVDLPPGTYKTTASLVMSADNVILRGSGWGTVIKPASGAQFDVISTPIPGSAGLAGFVRNYIGIEQLMLDCSSMTGTTAGQGNGIHFYGVRYSFIRDVYVKSCKNWAILLDGDNTGPGNNFGYDCQVARCVFDLCNANLWNTNTEAQTVFDTRFKWCGSATAALQPALGTQDTTSMHLRCSGGYMSILSNVFGKGGTYTTEAIRLSNSGPCKVLGNRFDQVRNQAIVMNGGNHMFIGNQLGSPGSAISGVPGIQIGSSKNTIIGNKFDVTAGAMNCTYCIAESGGPFSDNLIADNNLLTGTTGFINQNATSTNKVHHNAGYNPVGKLGPPAIPASTVAYTNNYGVDCTVHIAGGTLTVISIGGNATGITAAAAAGSVHTVRVPAGQTIAITYTVVPTAWSWFGD